MDGAYLDWAATARPDAEAWRAGLEAALDAWANPSSAHSGGKRARSLLEEARRRVAAALGAKPDGMTFCSGATEANQIILQGALRRKARLIVSAVEHASIHAAAESLSRLGLPVAYLPVDSRGRVDPERAARALDGGPAVLCVMAVNNETGAVQDMAAIVRAVRAAPSGARVHIHSDAVQALGKLPFDGQALGLDSWSASAHKLGGPRGSGILWTARRQEALLRGGGQEGGLRAGTENLAAILSTAIVVEKAMAGLQANLARGRELEAAAFAALGSYPGAAALPSPRAAGDPGFSPWILQAALPGIPGEVAVRILDDLGVAASTGSACSSAKADRRVLSAMGVDEDSARRAFRLSWGPGTADAEMAALSAALAAAPGAAGTGREGR